MEKQPWHKTIPSEEILVVGGSLSGLTFALACATRGIRTQVLERVSGQHRGGGALAIDRALLLRAIGVNPRDGDLATFFPVLTERRQAVAWHEIYRWLLDLARQQKEINLIGGVTISRVVQDENSATAITAEGDRIKARAIVGADGYRSVVRSAVCPEQPAASYAGYVLWRGLVHEADLPRDISLPSDNDGDALINQTGYRLIAYPVAGPGGSLEPGKRLISFAWYDFTRTALLQQLGCLSSDRQILASLLPGSVPKSVRDELCGLADEIWPEPWSAAIIHALKRRDVFATPVAEYLPEHLCGGRLAILGDAAHIVSPMTGRGFVAGILDAEALADCLANEPGGVRGDVSSALKRYQDTRLADVRALAAKSIELSQAYLNDPGTARKIVKNKI